MQPTPPNLIIISLNPALYHVLSLAILLKMPGILEAIRYEMMTLWDYILGYSSKQLARDEELL